MTLGETEACVEYRITADDLLVDVNQGWEDFALGNCTPQLLSNQVIGRPLWDFIVDEETRYLYQTLLEKVRTTGESVSLHLRCDSPDRRRFIRLDVKALSAGRVQFVGTLLRVEFRDVVSLLVPGIDRSDELLNICGWCKSVCLPDGRYVEIEEAAELLSLFSSHRMPRLNHGICAECRSRVLSTLSGGEGAGKAEG